MKVSGDLCPAYFGNVSIQEELARLYDNQFESTTLELKWERQYYLDESDGSLFDKMLDPSKNKYELYNFSAHEFKERLFDAALAKVTVGIATVNFWAWSDAVYLYQSHFADTVQELGGKRVHLKGISDEVVRELISMYAIILQERVIGAIKHMESGAMSYAKYGLERLGSGNEWRSIEREIYETFPFMKTPESAEEKNMYVDLLYFLQIISALFSRSRLNLFTSLQNMYRIYNGGQDVKDPLADVVKETPFYRIISILDEWREELVVSKSKVVINDPF